MNLSTLRAALLDSLRFRPASQLLSWGIVAFTLAWLLAATGAATSPFWKFDRQIVLQVWGVVGANWLVLYVLAIPRRSDWLPLGLALLGGGALAYGLIPDFWVAATKSWFTAFVPFILAGIYVFVATAARYVRGHTLEGPQSEHVTQLAGLLSAMLFTLLFVLSADVLLAPTFVFHPQTFDARAWMIDAQYGVEPSALVAGTLSASALLHGLAAGAYNALSFAIPLLYAAQLRSRRPQVWNFLWVWAVLTALAIVAYHLFPVAGPRYWLGDQFFAPVDAVPHASAMPLLVAPHARNGMPSMHFGWAFAMWVASLWVGSRRLRWVLGALATTMVFATLGLGEHYLIDLVVAVPFVLAVMAATMHNVPWSSPERTFAAAGGLALYLSWIGLMRWGDSLLLTTPAPVWILTAVTVAFAWKALRGFEHLRAEITCGRLAGGYAGAPLEWAPRPTPLPGTMPRGVLSGVLSMFFLSGFASLIYEVLFTKQLALIFGSNAEASYSVLAAYMGGMAVGAWIGGRLYKRHRDGLYLYFLFELVIGLYCLAAPLLLRGLDATYVMAASNVRPETWWLLPLRLGLGVALLAGPTVMMGASLPVLVIYLRDRFLAQERAVAVLYGVNTLGAAVGAFCAGYLIIPTLGLHKTTMVAAMINLLVGYFALRLRRARTKTDSDPERTAMRVLTQDASPVATYPVLNPSRLAMAVLALTGLVAMIVETNYVHLLAVVAGTSAYAFALMLATFLLGLGAGSLALQQQKAWRRAPASTVVWLLAGLSLSLAMGALQWAAMADYFASYAGYPFPREFGAYELVRGAVCFLAMFPPAFFIGSLYPVAVHWAVPSGLDAIMGKAFAINTLGNIVGILLGGFLLLPWVGANVSVKIAGGLCVGLAVTVLLRARPPSFRLAGLVVGMAAVALAMVPWSLDMTRVATGANVYFAAQKWGDVVDYAESVDGGLTAVSVAGAGTANMVRTLTTNGKFQGNDAALGEMRAQLGFAVTPLLHQPARDKALVIGYGTGMTARVLHEAGFAHIDIADLSRDIVNLADKHFASINGRVSQASGVDVHIVDGRNFLLLQDRSFDLIGIELTSIWFAGASSLYNKDFYELAHRRLKPNGVLQQWVQLHHMSPEDVMRVIGSVRAVFPHVWLYVVGGQGMIIAGNTPAAEPQIAYADKLSRSASLASLFAQVHSSVAEVAAARLLDPQGVDRLLGGMGVGRDYWISTDDNSALEYSTPRGNVLDSDLSYKTNMRLLTNGGAHVPTAP